MEEAHISKAWYCDPFILYTTHYGGANRMEEAHISKAWYCDPFILYTTHYGGANRMEEAHIYKRENYLNMT